MLKEGWDVTNLYTIIPLRAANARTLVEQSIGRGLRLPYGKRTGIPAVDRLNIIAHDRFQEIVDEANRSDSPIHLKTVILDPDSDHHTNKSIITQSNLANKILGTSEKGHTSSGKNTINRVESVFKTETERKVAAAVLTAIKKQEHLPSATYLLKPEVQASILSDVETLCQPDIETLPGVYEEVDKQAIIQKVTETVIQETIDIPRIIVVPRGHNTVGFKDFELDCSSIQFKPVERDLLIRHLRTNSQETLSFLEGKIEDVGFEDLLVRGLIDFEDISYDEHADLLYNLAAQLVTHLRTYLKSDDEVRNVII
jgi:type III restriction enzyme